MKIVVSESSKALGKAAACEIEAYLKQVISKNNYARIVLSTGASQLDTIEALIKSDIDWTKVEMFHLDEYVDLPLSHGASFRKYLKERFIDKVPLMNAYLVDGTDEGIAELSKKLREKDVDLGVVGIGENGHIAFNDPPADFNTKEAYIKVLLDEDCKLQQVREGWFATLDDVPKQAVTMTCYQIMKCKKIITCVPYKVKSQAIYDTLTKKVTNAVPATLLKTHPDWTLFLDEESSSKVFPK